MQQRHTQNERALKIVQEIQQNHYPTAKTLSDQIEVCEKPIQRDIELTKAMSFCAGNNIG